jgi:hypothetical protein
VQWLGHRGVFLFWWRRSFAIWQPATDAQELCVSDFFPLLPVEWSARSGFLRGWALPMCFGPIGSAFHADEYPEIARVSMAGGMEAMTPAVVPLLFHRLDRRAGRYVSSLMHILRSVGNQCVARRAESTRSRRVIRTLTSSVAVRIACAAAAVAIHPQEPFEERPHRRLRAMGDRSTAKMHD